MTEHRSILEIYKNTHYSFIFKIDLCSATSMESSRRDLLNDMAKHTSTLKNNQHTYYPRFSFTPKTGIAFPKAAFDFSVNLGYVACASFSTKGGTLMENSAFQNHCTIRRTVELLGERSSPPKLGPRKSTT